MPGDQRRSTAGRRHRRTPKHAGQCASQLVVADRLGEVGRRSCHLALAALGECRHQHDRRAADQRVGLDQPRQGQAVESRHRDVQDGRIERLALQRSRMQRCNGCDRRIQHEGLHAPALCQIGEERAAGRMVVDDQHAHRTARRAQVLFSRQQLLISSAACESHPRVDSYRGSASLGR